MEPTKNINLGQYRRKERGMTCQEIIDGIKELPSIGSLLDSYDVYESHIKPVIRQEIVKESELN